MAQIDSWMTYASTSFDLSLQMSSIDEWNRAIFYLNRHLENKSYVVGDHVSVADIRIIATLYAAEEGLFWKPKSGTNVSRWYESLMQEDWFQKSLCEVRNHGDNL